MKRLDLAEVVKRARKGKRVAKRGMAGRAHGSWLDREFGNRQTRRLAAVGTALAVGREQEKAWPGSGSISTLGAVQPAWTVTRRASLPHKVGRYDIKEIASHLDFSTS